MIFLVMGPQGSGKSTQAKLLAERIGVPFVSLGEIFRKLNEENNPLGTEAARYWEDGELVPDDLVRQVLEQYFHVNEVGLSRGFVMDGFPRDVDQYCWLKEIFPEPVTAVVLVDLDEQTVWQRLVKRRESEHRVDETTEAIRERLQNYHRQTEPVTELFKTDATPFFRVDGRPKVEDVQLAIWQVLEKIVTGGRIK